MATLGRNDAPFPLQGCIFSVCLCERKTETDSMGIVFVELLAIFFFSISLMNLFLVFRSLYFVLIAQPAHRLRDYFIKNRHVHKLPHCNVADVRFSVSMASSLDLPLSFIEATFSLWLYVSF